jgi:hypothetical protein
MSYQEHRIVYRQQFETANPQTGKVNREFIEACYVIVMVDHETGHTIPTNKSGIIKIPLAKYPGLHDAIEAFVPVFIDAFEQEYKEKLAAELVALESMDNDPLVQ